jgi:cathepsin D
VKRDNKFPVVLSNQPSNPNALAIHQDGSDFSYFSTVKFGSEGKEMYMLIDTGSANTWVMGSTCKSASCGIHNTFGSADSNTLKMTTKAWSLAYGTGEVDGLVASDKVAFAGYSLDLSFGLASVASDDFNNYPMDGILGFGPPQSNELGTKTIMAALDDQTKLKDNILGVHLQRAADGTKDGELIIGGIDKSKFSGDLNYLPAVNANSWEIKVDDAYVGGSACGLSGKTAMIDTGTSYLLMPPSDADAVHSKIPGSAHNGEMFALPCDSSVSLQIGFNGVKYTVSPKDYVGKVSGSGCISNIIGHQAFGPGQWILGDVFLKNVYTVFDFDKDRIGRFLFSIRSTI